jgi:hypothetical protein
MRLLLAIDDPTFSEAATRAVAESVMRYANCSVEIVRMFKR